MNEIQDDAIEKYLESLGRKPRKAYWYLQCRKHMQAAQANHPRGGEVLFSEERLTKGEFRVAYAGENLEQFQMELEESLNQVEECKRLLQESINQIVALNNQLFPLMKEQIQFVRSSRMSIGSETKETLAAMRAMREFFMDSDYETEMARMERFIALCREFRSLKAEGILDEVSSLAIRMALRESA